MKYKKILLGSLAAGITTLVPIATIISCGKTADVKVAVPTKDSVKLTFKGIMTDQELLKFRF